MSPTDAVMGVEEEKMRHAEEEVSAEVSSLC
jgi:hypothetical protein